MRFHHLFCVLIAFGMVCGVSGCASPHMSSELQAGRIDFQSGNYFRAFRQLLPVAQKGRPEAQYAVGYMYYYGLGVRQNMQVGLHWIESAAAQGYGPALEALEMIHHREGRPVASSVAAHPAPGRSSYASARHTAAGTHGQQQPKKPVVVSQGQSGLQAVRAHSPAKSVTHRPRVLSVMHREKLQQQSRQQQKKQVLQQMLAQRLVASQRAGKQYVLQFYGSHALARVKSLRQQLGLGHSATIYRTKYKGRDWYVLTLGGFSTPVAALSKKHGLGPQLKNLHPWVRGLDGLQRV